MCDMHRRSQEEISLDEAKRVLETLAKNEFLIAYFTGGEPTLHPAILEIVAYADKLGLVTTMTTNGTVSKEILNGLKDAGLYLLSVSIDHWMPSICDEIRNHRNILTKQLETLRYAKSIGLRTYALAYLNPILLRDGVEKLVRFVNELGVPFGFCYPTTCMTNTYMLGGKLTQSQSLVDAGVREILYLKKNKGKIANLYCYLEDAVNFPRNPNFYCNGGEYVIYIDWFGDVYPCFLKGQKLFNILKGEEPRFLENVRCNECLTNCFREPSFLSQIFSKPALIAKELFHSYTVREIFK
jgi:MoaA/NifB/PqqE/SkfB family radical SAM enzyme